MNNNDQTREKVDFCFQFTNKYKPIIEEASFNYKDKNKSPYITLNFNILRNKAEIDEIINLFKHDYKKKFQSSIRLEKRTPIAIYNNELGKYNNLVFILEETIKFEVIVKKHGAKS